MKKNKLLFIITGLKKGGAERQLFNLIMGLKSRYTIRVISYTDGYYSKKLTNLGVAVNIIPTFTYFGFFKALLNTYRIIREYKPSIIQSMLPHANIVAKVINALHYKKFKLYTGVRNSKESKILGFLEKITDKFCDLIITNSYTTKNELVKRGFKEKKIKVIYNGIVFKKPKTRYSYDKKIILTVAKFYPQKDYKTNLAAIKRLINLGVNFRCQYVGDGPQRNEIQNLVIEEGLNEYIEFLGVRNDIPELMTSADVFFLPSLHEGQANVLLEAMFYELPIVTSDIPENREICEGMFLPTGHAKSFGNAIYQILNNYVDCSESIAINKHKIGKFTTKNMTESYFSIYQ